MVVVREQAASAKPAAVWWLGMAFLTFWAGLLVHEAAHYAVAWWVSLDWTTPALTWRSGASAAAGPMATLIIVGGCAAISGSAGRLRWVAVAAAIGAASRLALTAIPTIQGKANDEGTVGMVIGVSPRALWTIEAVLTVLLVSIVVRRSGASRQVLLLCSGAALVGWISAFTVGRAVGLRI